jgi:hypothetical protein
MPQFTLDDSAPTAKSLTPLGRLSNISRAVQLHIYRDIPCQYCILAAPSMTHAPSGPPSSGLALGTYQLGALITTLVYGVTLAQFYTYAISSKKDRLWLKLFVTLVWYVLSSVCSFSLL